MKRLQPSGPVQCNVSSCSRSHGIIAHVTHTHHPKGGDALLLQSKGRYGSSGVAGKTVWSCYTRAISERVRDVNVDETLYKSRHFTYFTLHTHTCKFLSVCDASYQLIGSKHIRSYRGRVSTSQMIQPAVSKHWRKAFNPTRSTSLCYNNIIQPLPVELTKNTPYTHIGPKQNAS